MVYLGSMQQQSSGSSGYDVGGMLSNGLSMVKEGFGFASGGGIAKVQTGTIGLVADTFTGDGPIAPTCSATAKNSYIGLINTGSGNGTATAVTIRYAGSDNTFPIAGSCVIGPSGSPTATTFVLFKGPSKLPNSARPQAGIQYSGSVSLSDGAQLPFVGTFSQGYASISNKGFVLMASEFTKGQQVKAINATCGATPGAAKSYVKLNNTGTIGASVTLLTISSKNATDTFSISGPCFVGPEGTPSAVTYIILGHNNSLNVAAEPGQSFNGTVTLSSKTQIRFSGQFH